MLDLTQTLLVIVVVVLTTILTMIGIQIIFILRDVRQLLTRTNYVLDRAEMFFSGVAQPLAGLGGLIEGVKHGVNVVERLSNVLGRKDKTTEVEEYIDSL